MYDGMGKVVYYEMYDRFKFFFSVFGIVGQGCVLFVMIKNQMGEVYGSGSNMVRVEFYELLVQEVDFYEIFVDSMGLDVVVISFRDVLEEVYWVGVVEVIVEGVEYKLFGVENFCFVEIIICDVFEVFNVRREYFFVF